MPYRKFALIWKHFFSYFCILFCVYYGSEVTANPLAHLTPLSTKVTINTRVSPEAFLITCLCICKWCKEILNDYFLCNKKHECSLALLAKALSCTEMIFKSLCHLQVWTMTQLNEIVLTGAHINFIFIPRGPEMKDVNEGIVFVPNSVIYCMYKY